MTTLYDRLNAYCNENGVEIPEKHSRFVLGNLIGDEFRRAFPESPIERIAAKETIYVNSYPDDFMEKVDEMIVYFITNQKEILAEFPSPKKKQRSFGYDVAAQHAEMFESVLAEFNIPVRKNSKTVKLIQYKVEFEDPATLVDLGQAFARKLQEAISKSAAIPEKRVRKRVPLYSSNKN